MNNRSRITALAISINCVWMTLPTSAQERDVRFLAWDEKVSARPVSLVSGEKQIPIQNLHPLQRSEALRIRTVESGIQLIALDHTDPDTATFSISIPTRHVRPLVILIPDQAAACGLRGIALEDSPETFQWGSVRLLNATHKTVLMRLGTSAKSIPVGFTPVDFAPTPPGNHPVLIAARDNPDRPVYSSIWTTDPDSRRLVFIIPSNDARLGSISLKVIPEFRLQPSLDFQP